MNDDTESETKMKADGDDNYHPADSKKQDHAAAVVALCKRFPGILGHISQNDLALLGSEVLTIVETEFVELNTLSSAGKMMVKFAQSNALKDALIALNDASMAHMNAISSIQRVDELVLKSPEEIDILLETAARVQDGVSLRWNPSNYADDSSSYDKSYGTVHSSSLFSTTTVIYLNSGNVHFMMFREGETKIVCHRFSFKPTTAFYNASATQDRKDIPQWFYDFLGLRVDKDLLYENVERLEHVQCALRNMNFPPRETVSQALFRHVLRCLVTDLQRNETNKYEVIDITGMQDVDVQVHVCSLYLNLQRKYSDTSNQRVSLKLKSDLAVVVRGTSVKTKKDLKEGFLRCLYHIEMKSPFNSLVHGGLKPKSQLICESLARSLAFNETELPKAIFSVLSDCCSLYVMVHFPESQCTYLSHRETEPGRMIAVLAWLHFTSKELFTEDDLKRVFSIGSTLQIEMQSAFDKRTKSKRGDGMGEPRSDSTPSAKRRRREVDSEKDDHSDDCARSTQSSKQENALSSSNEAVDFFDQLVLDLAAEDEDGKDRKTQKTMQLFSDCRSLYHYGTPLPLTEDVLRAIEKKNLSDGTVQECSYYSASIQRMRKYSGSVTVLNNGTPRDWSRRHL